MILDITENLNLLKGYYKYIYEKPDVYCIDAGNVAKEYDNEDIKVSNPKYLSESDLLKLSSKLDYQKEIIQKSIIDRFCY